MKVPNKNRTRPAEYLSASERLRKSLTMEEKLENPSGSWTENIKKEKNSRLTKKNVVKKVKKIN